MTSGGIMLFESRSFCHILEEIFFNLDPRSLRACSLVCRYWHDVIQRRVLSTPSGERRLTHNWIHRPPVQRHLILRRRGIGDREAARDTCLYTDAPSSNVANQ